MRASVRRLRNLTLALGAALFVAASGAACGGGDEVGRGFGESTAAERVCSNLKSYTEACAEPWPCGEALVADCSDVVGVLSEDLLDGFAACLDDDGDPASCLSSALGAVEPTPAHEQFASSFCGSCAFGVPGCEGMLTATEGELALVGKVALALSAELAEELTAQCTGGVGCAATFASCAQSVLVARAVPEQATSCLIGGLTGGSELSGCNAQGAASGHPDPTGGSGAESGSTSGHPGSGAGGAGASGSGGSGGGGSGSGGSGGTGGSSTCDHPECQVGVTLEAGCSPCADSVCAADPYCCDTEWDIVCVGEAASHCDCTPICAGDANEPNGGASSATGLDAADDGMITDCEGDQWVDGEIESASDQDWFTYYGLDAICGFDAIQPHAQAFGANVEVCVYLSPAGGGSYTPVCLEGVASSVGTVDGCCGPGSARLQYGANFATDEATVLIRVRGADAAACAPYTLSYGYGT